MRKFIWYAGIVLFYSISFAVEPPTICQLGINSTPELVALWHMNFDEDPIRDSSINSHTGVLTGAGEPNFVAGKIGGAYDFDGNDDLISVADHSDLSFGDKVDDYPFTLMVWCNMVDATEFRIMSKGGYGTNDWEYLFFTDVNDKLKIHIYDESVAASFPSIIMTTAITAYQGSWIHTAMTYDGRGGPNPENGLKIYFNGSIAATSIAATGATYVAMENDLGHDFEIGSGDGVFADGDIDEGAVFNRELSAAEIENIYYRNSRSQ